MIAVLISFLVFVVALMIMTIILLSVTKLTDSLIFKYFYMQVPPICAVVTYTIVTLMYKLRPVIADKLFDSSYLLYVKYEQEEKREEEKLHFKRLAEMRYEEEKEERIKELSKW